MALNRTLRSAFFYLFSTFFCLPKRKVAKNPTALGFGGQERQADQGRYTASKFSITSVACLAVTGPYFTPGFVFSQCKIKHEVQTDG
jgi:hypothetical protein